MSDTHEIEILIVEDDDDDLDMTLYALKKAKVANKIQVVRDGEEALEFVFCQGAFADRRMESVPKVILLDLKLPKVDGFEVLRKIKSDPRTKNIPIVVLTSSKEQKDVVESYNLGVNSYMVKPVSFKGFAEAVEQLGMYWMLLNQSPRY